MVIDRAAPQHLSKAVFHAQRRKWTVIHTQSARFTRSVWSLNNPYIWMTKFVCTSPIQSPVFLSRSITAFSLIAFLLSESPLLCRNRRASADISFFPLFAFGWGDTRHIEEPRHPGGILIGDPESVCQGRRRETEAAQRRRERVTQRWGSEKERLSSKEIKWKDVCGRQRERSKMEI